MEWFNGLADLVRERPDLAVWVVGAFAFGESVAFLSFGLPLMIPLLAVTTALGAMGVDLKPIFVAAAIGAIAGYQISYWVGFYLKDSAHNIWPFSKMPEATKKAQALLNRWGWILIYPSHFSGPLRAVTPTLVGASGMGHITFVLHNVVSSVIWAAATVFFPGYFGRLLG